MNGWDEGANEWKSNASKNTVSNESDTDSKAKAEDSGRENDEDRDNKEMDNSEIADSVILKMNQFWIKPMIKKEYDLRLKGIWISL